MVKLSLSCFFGYGFCCCGKDLDQSNLGKEGSFVVHHLGLGQHMLALRCGGCERVLLSGLLPLTCSVCCSAAPRMTSPEVLALTIVCHFPLQSSTRKTHNRLASGLSDGGIFFSIEVPCSKMTVPGVWLT